MSKEFKVGDRVRVAKQGTSGLDKDVVKGDTGTVVVVGFCDALLVKFDQPRKQYSSGRSLKLKNGYWCNPVNLEHINTDPAATEKIIITTDGKTTTARRYKGKELLGSAEAVCSPSDPFDFERGAIIAFARLSDCDYKLADAEEAKPGPKFKVGDVVRVKGTTQVDHGLAVGSLAVIYKVKPSTYYGYVYSCDGGELRQHVGEADLEKAKPEPKFKVGDVVRVRSSRTIGHTLVIDSLAVVHECSRAQSVDGFRYFCCGSNRVSNAGQYVHENDLEKYEMPTKGE